MRKSFHKIFPIFLFALVMLTAERPVFADLSWDAAIDIHAPSYSYEGHSIKVYDNSLFHLGSVTNEQSFRNARTAAEGGFISSSWEGDYIQQSAIVLNGCCLEQHIVFPDPGMKLIKLSTTWLRGDLTGQSEQTVKLIDIRSCPYLDSAVLGGEQRAYQRQSLTLGIARHPSYPLLSVSVDIYDKNGNRISFQRPLKKLEEAGCFESYELEFLTKNAADELFIYEIRALDSRGEELCERRAFKVARDKAPEAVIKMSNKYYRAEGGAPAVISASLLSKSDDSLLCSWSCTKLSGNEELIFQDAPGSLDSFDIASVGRYRLSVKCTDQWGDSLSEFASDSERKSAVFSKDFTVDNLAPVLGKLKKTKSLELLLVNPDFGSGSIKSADDERLPEAIAALSEALLEKGLRAEIRTSFVNSNEAAGELSLLAALSLPYSMNNGISNSFFEACTGCDDKYLYKLLPSSRLVRYSLNDFSDTLNITIPFGGYSAEQLHPFIGTDDQSRYCYLILTQNRKKPKSLIIDNETGGIEMSIDMQLGQFNYIFHDSIYSLSPEGMLRIKLGDKSCSNIFPAVCLQNGGESARIYHNRIIFVTAENGTLYLCAMSLPSQGGEPAFTKTELGPDASALCSAARTQDYLLNISPSGKILIASQAGERITQTTRLIIRGWDSRGDQSFDPIETVPAVKTRVNIKAAYPVYEPDGNAGHIALAAASPGSFILTNLESGEAQSVSYGIAAGMKHFSRHNEYFILGSGAQSQYAQNGSISFSVYKYSEGYPNNADRKAAELLSFEAEHTVQTGIADAEYIAACCGAAASSQNEFERPSYKLGDIPDLKDFGISPDCFEDFENDKPFQEHTSMDISRPLNTAGYYSFYYWVSDEPGDSAFKKSSKKLKLHFSVVKDDGSLPEGEENGGGGAGGQSSESGGDETPEGPANGIKKYRLHRRY